MRISTFFFLLFIASSVFGQELAKMERIDSVSKSKDQIYADTKMFIAEYWKSAQNVIQNDDKENGVILVKGSMKESLVFMMNTHDYYYSYSVKFFMKEGRYRILLDNVKCSSAVCAGNSWPLVEFCDVCEYPGYGPTGMPKEAWAKLQLMIGKEFSNLFDGYSNYIKSTSITNADW
jgi:hypothetical protein